MLPLYLAQYPQFKKGVEILEEIQRRARKRLMNGKSHRSESKSKRVICLI